jgi:hypothetical protein
VDLELIIVQIKVFKQLVDRLAKDVTENKILAKYARRRCGLVI